MKAPILAAAGLLALVACQSETANIEAACHAMVLDEVEVQSFLAEVAVSEDDACDCFARTIVALPEAERTKMEAGLTDMVAVRRARVISMQEVFNRYRSGEESVTGKPYTIDDLSELGDLFEDTVETIGGGEACPTS